MNHLFTRRSSDNISPNTDHLRRMCSFLLYLVVLTGSLGHSDGIIKSNSHESLVIIRQDSTITKSPHDDERPTLKLTARPRTGFTPSRVTFRGVLTGGPDDFKEYYCPVIEWDWGDGTISENSSDCEPYEAGKSTLKRRFTAQHVFNMAGTFKIRLILKRNDKTLVATNTQVRIRPGGRPR